MRLELRAPAPSGLDNLSSGYLDTMQKWIPFALQLLMPFAVGLLVGVAFTWFIRGRGWRSKVISVWPISVMFGTLAYVIAPAIVFVALTDIRPRMLLSGLTASVFYTWPIWLVMGPVFFIYVAHLKRREKWLKDSTVVYLSAFSLIAESTFMFLLSWH
jgi:hypothetical protein